MAGRNGQGKEQYMVRVLGYGQPGQEQRQRQDQRQGQGQEQEQRQGQGQGKIAARAAVVEVQ